MDRRGIPSGRLHSKSTTDPKWMTESLYAESFRRQKRRGKSSSDASMFELAPSEFMSRCSSSAIDNESFRSTRDHLSPNSSQRSSNRIPTGQGEGQMFPRRYGSQGGDSEMLGASQREIPDDSSSRNIFINDPDRTNSEYVFAGNKIRTSKYSVLTFLPRNLFEQFHRVAYIYFLILIILNQLPWLAVFSSVTSALPLAFVLLVTAVKDGYEDWRRHRSDKNENNREAEVWGAGGFQPKTWKDIRVGEVIRIKSNETLPCDVVLLSTSDPSGVAYVQTINLDGESNLKIRYAKQETGSRMKEGESPIGATIRCEQPNRNIYKFLANIEIEGKKVSLGPANVVLRGCELKNTSWAIGVAIYAGQETKVMLNSSGAPSKRSRLENYMNDEVLYLVLFLIIMCTVAGIGSGVWLGQHKDELNTLPYYRKRYFNSESNKPYNYYGIAAEIVFAVLTAVIIFQIMVPIALYISMELVRVGQAYFMIRDKRMYDETTKSKFQCRALNINEDLGQIKYVFSDKTGTLTENKMEFHDASVFGKNYSISKIKISTDEEIQQILHHVTDEVDGKLIKPKMEVKVDPRLLQLLKQEEITEEKKFAHDFFLTLAACNTIVPIMHETSEERIKEVEYQGESPDEQALVYAAASYGYVLTERTSGHVIVYVQGEKQRLEVLGLHEFDSERKRMSVIVRTSDKKFKLLVKGADSSVINVVDKEFHAKLRETKGCADDMVSATQSHLQEYSSQGLRTLVLASKELTSADYERWHRKYEEASNSLTGRQRKLRDIASAMECNLKLLGATGIEDKLQNGVPETIEALRQAGVKVWVLTGDKQETAISIGISCKLIASNMEQIIINGKNKEDCQELIKEAKATYSIQRQVRNSAFPQRRRTMSYCIGDRVEAVSMSNLSRPPLALIIDGTSLVHILENDLEDELYDLATECEVVLCCRVAPLQKAGIVSLIKKRTPDMTLAIGDGANDVSMIQMADVGVGISGQEGRQAVMASDFAMGQFRFLERLLLVHGHWNYNRMSYMILYNFYRNALYVFVLFWYVLHTAFTATTAITDWSGVLYSIIYTSLPTIVVGIMDQDLSDKTLTRWPKLYAYGQREEGYNGCLFWLTMLDTLWQSLVIGFVAYFTYKHSTIDIWSIGNLWTIAIVMLVNLQLAMDVSTWTWLTHVSIWGSIIATWICLLIIDVIPVLPNYWTFFHVITRASYWLDLILILCLALLPRFLIKFARQRFWPSDIQIFCEREISERNSVRSAVELTQIRSTA